MSEGNKTNWGGILGGIAAIITALSGLYGVHQNFTKDGNPDSSSRNTDQPEIEPQPPETDDPETDDPETDDPETDDPETDDPELDIPELDIPELDIPELDVPELDVSETFWLADDEFETVGYYLYEGETLFGSCDDYCYDIDLFLYDEYGEKIAEDIGPDSTPYIDVPYAGDFEIVIVMVDCKDPIGCIVSLESVP